MAESFKAGSKTVAPNRTPNRKNRELYRAIVAEVCQMSILRTMARGEASKTSEQWTWVARATVKQGYRIEN